MSTQSLLPNSLCSTTTYCSHTHAIVQSCSGSTHECTPTDPCVRRGLGTPPAPGDNARAGVHTQEQGLAPWRAAGTQQLLVLDRHGRRGEQPCWTATNSLRAQDVPVRSSRSRSPWSCRLTPRTPPSASNSGLAGVRECGRPHESARAHAQGTTCATGYSQCCTWLCLARALRCADRRDALLTGRSLQARPPQRRAQTRGAHRSLSVL